MLLKYGKIHALLNDMESDAAENIREAESNLLNFFRELWNRRSTLGTAYVEARVYGGVDEIIDAYHKHMDVSHADRQRGEELASLLQVQRDAFALARGIRKFAPFIEAGAMTIAEAISCETQRSAVKAVSK